MSLLAKSRPGLSSEPRLPRRETAVGHIVGLAMTLAGAGMLLSAVVEKVAGGSDAVILLASGLLVGIPGFALWNRTRAPGRVPAATIFAAVLFGWITFTLVSTIPYLASGTFTRFDLALFEAVAGVTTTSATVLRLVESVAPGLLFWRAMTQWIGGIAAVVFAVSVLPFLGVGGMELVRTPAPGPASERLGPRVRATASRLVPVYVGFTVLVAVAYTAFGMSVFDGVTHAFTTVSTGGFSTHDLSFASFDSAALEWIAIVAMVVAGGSLALYWRALRGKPLVVFRSAEFHAYIALTALMCVAAVAWSVVDGGYDIDLVRRTIFTTVSLTSTTGYRMLDFDTWAPAVQLLLVFAVGLGGMAASPAGGFKVFRLMAVLSYARRQLYIQLHPKAVAVIRFGNDVVPDIVVARIVGFFGLFMAAGAAATFLVAAFGADVRTAVSAVASAIGNVGPGLGEVGPMRHFADLHAGIRGVLMVVMLVGRLEVYPVLLGAVPLMRFVGDHLPRPAARALVRAFRG
jgi:trk system potassium uptake protein TrkH